METVSVMLASRAIESADIAVLVVDASVGVTDQDAAIAGAADKAGRGIILAANKWDLMKDRGSEFVKEFDEELRRRLKFLDYAPVLHISATTGERTPRLLEMIYRVAVARSMRVKTAELNAFVKKVTDAHPPASPGRTHVRVLYAAQTAVAPPTFVLFTNVATEFHFSYERFLVNRIREEFGFLGSADPAPRQADDAGTAPGRACLGPVILSRVAPKLYKAADVCESTGTTALRAALVGEGVSWHRGSEITGQPAPLSPVRRRSGAAHQAARVQRGTDVGRRTAPARGVATAGECPRGCGGRDGRGARHARRGHAGADRARSERSPVDPRRAVEAPRGDGTC